ncbi:MAG: hypothetical protein HN548_06855 [Opitutae bacterium]|nr:hypothetical protein [Opitutae bacterium]MBT5715824.1 hypothetical protein [Opitutae bacterium]
MSSKRLSSSRINSVSSQRFSVSEWPSKFSSFGGKRYPMAGKKTWGTERIETSTIDVELPHNQNFASENTKRSMNAKTENKSPAAASIQFRDAYYAQLDKRVDEWMGKVNNMSLRDINRFQFRKGRPSEPGFPVQQAGSQDIPMTSSEKKLGSSNVRGVIPSGQRRTGAGRPSYWLGPKKMVSSSTSGKVSASNGGQTQAKQVKKNFQSLPQPILGPKKVRVQLK